ncbi:hypothetical protein NEF87_003787 [Candidatus Lokiarchaeum ossiferum]|uniref:SnoaL-like polyketide cyclase n=1 Tax=Candidatus Lokiarchaeum ossiferum TaxID=2951803 RepID=A0ABY6HXC7_9ARCH|nr:hypothetical protein NEF87_003787 [Candidatus Lokiarchaeum sp. B-35]
MIIFFSLNFKLLNNMNDRNLEFIGKQWFEVMWSLPDLDLADELVDTSYHPDWIQMDKQGPALVQHEIRYFRSIFPDLSYNILEMKADENKVWVWYRGTGTQEGAGWGFKPTGKTISFEGAAIIYVNFEGKVSNLKDAFSFYDIFVDLGVIPPFWELYSHLKDFPKKKGL